MATLPKTNSEPTGGEKRFAQQVLLRGEAPLWMQWVTKRKRDKTQDRLLVVGKYKIFSIKRTLTGKKQIQRAGHFFDLKELYSGDADRLVFKFRDFDIDVQAPGAGSDLLQKIRENIQSYTYSFADYALPRVVLVPAERILPQLPSIDPGPANGLLATYEAYCDYYNLPSSEEFKKFVIDLVNQGSTEFTLDECPGIERKENPINFTPIRASLRHNTYFTSFVFKNITRRDVSESVADMLTHNITLKTIFLHAVDAREDSFVNIGVALKKNQLNNVIDIDFSRNPVKDKGALGLADGFQFLAHSLWRLNLSSCGIGSKGIAAILQAFCFGKDVARGIQELNLSDNSIGQTGSIQMCNWFNQATVNCQLRYLLIANTRPDLQMIFRSLKNATIRSLEEVDISGIKVDQATAFAIASVIDTLPKLQVFSAANCGMTSQQFETIFRSITGNQNINDVILNFSNNEVGVNGAVTVAQFLVNSFNIGGLYLRGCGFKKEGLTKLVEALQQNLERTRLKVLDLSMNFSQGTASKMLKLISSLGEAIKKHPQLEYLGLAGDGNKSSIGKEIEPLLKAFASNPNLVELDITGNKIGDQLSVTFSDSLRTNTHLKSISWDNNGISIGGWRALLNVLSTNRTLVHCPPPTTDIEKAIKEAKNKEQFRDKTKEVIDQIRDVLKQNSGAVAYVSLYSQKLGKTFREVHVPTSGEAPQNFNELNVSSSSSYNNDGYNTMRSSSYSPPLASNDFQSPPAPPSLSIPGNTHYSPAPSSYDAPPPPPPPPGAAKVTSYDNGGYDDGYGYDQPPPPPGSDDYYGGQQYADSGYGYGGYDQPPPAYDYPTEFDDSQYEDADYSGGAPPPPPPPPM